MLSDLVVVDLTRALAGPHAAMMLADLGARVIKLESPAGDDSRTWGPPFVGPEDDPVSTYFLSANRNKESVTADLRTEEGREFLTRLVARADVLMENFRTGVLDRLGFSTERLHEINPRLVVLSITGFGHDGPEGGRAGYDQIAQGEAGLMSLTGPSADEPTRVGVPIGDLLAGMYGAYGVMAALHERSLTGRGRVVRTSLLASVVGVHAYHGTRWTVAHEVPHATGNHHAVDLAVRPVPHRRRPGADRLRHREAVAGAGRAARPRRPRFGSNRARVGLRSEVVAAVEAALAAEPAEVWLARLADARRPGRQGAHPRRRLHLGPDALPGPARRRRPPHRRPDPAARAGAALRRQRARRGPHHAPPAAAARRARRRPSGPGSTPTSDSCQ